MTKRTASELDLEIESDLKKRKLSDHDNNNHNIKNGENTSTNNRQSFLRSKRKWIQYESYVNHEKAWNRYSLCMENVYNASFPDLRSLKIGNLLTFRKNAQFEFMNGIIIRCPNANPLNIYSESSSRVCIKLLSESLSTQSINQQMAKMNNTKESEHFINTEADIYSFIPSETFNFEYFDHNNNNNNDNDDNPLIMPTTKKKRKIHKKAMKFDSDIVCINLCDYEVFEHREIVWSLLEGFEWFPSQILFKWKYGERVSPSMAKQQFGLVFILVAFFDVIQTASIRLSQRHLLPFHNEANIDLMRRTKAKETKHINNAMILASLQQEINKRLHAQYHTDTHIKNALILRNLEIPKHHWLYQRVLTYDRHTQVWKGGRIMYYLKSKQKHFIVYDDDCVTQWIDLDDMEYIDWCNDSNDHNDEYMDWCRPISMNAPKPVHADIDDKMHTLSGDNMTIHNIAEIHGFGVDECSASTTKVPISRRLIAFNIKNCNKCWVCHEFAMINVSPICSVHGESDAQISIHCICCRRRAHLTCLRKNGMNRDILAHHLLSIHCDECMKCALCKRELEPQSIVKWCRTIADLNTFMNEYINTGMDRMKECNLCRRHFHKQCLPKTADDCTSLNNELWLCFDCRMCRCCDKKESDNDEWFEGYTLCAQCNAKKDAICAVCFKRTDSLDSVHMHEPFLIQCNECSHYIHLSCSPFTLDRIAVNRTRNIHTLFICSKCNEVSMRKLQFNVLRYLIQNDNDSGRCVVNHLHCILMLRTHCLCSRITLLHFINIFHEIWRNQSNDEMISFLCEIIAKYFNHIFNEKISMKPSVLNIMKSRHDIHQYMYQSRYISSHKSLILCDICASCGSTQDIDKLIICKRCAVPIHSYCIRSATRFSETDNTGYCYPCLWYCYENKKCIAKTIVLQTNDATSPWKMEQYHLFELYQLSQKNELNGDTFDAFMIRNKIPLWIKPLLCDLINDAHFTTEYKQRMTTNTVYNKEETKASDRHRSTLYSAIQYQDGATLNDDRKCALCNNNNNNNDDMCGRLLPVNVGVNARRRRRRRECEWIHTKCILSSTDNCNPHHYHKYGSNLIRINVTHVLNQCRQFKCHLCHLYGASMHCSVPDCTLSYHYPCIVSSQMYDIDWKYNSRPFFCNLHKMHFNNNHYSFGAIQMIDFKTNEQNLYDECCIVLNDENDWKFVSSSNHNLYHSKAKQMFEIKGNTVIKSMKDRKDENRIILQQIYDTFWSYQNPGKRTQFVYESYAVDDAYSYKLIVTDDPISSTTFCSNNSAKIFTKLIKKYPNTFETDLFKSKYSYFL